MTREEYAEYLQSVWWARRRWVALERAGYRCQRCGFQGTRSEYSNVTTGVHVHHLRYDNLGHEPDEDLCVLCPRCHGEIHGLPQSVPGFETLAPYIRDELGFALAESQFEDELEAAAEEINW